MNAANLTPSKNMNKISGKNQQTNKDQYFRGSLHNHALSNQLFDFARRQIQDVKMG